MSTSIDQAFQKAYAKRVPQLRSSEPQSEPTVAQWIDEPDGTQLRHDQVQPISGPHFNSKGARPNAQVATEVAPPPVEAPSNRTHEPLGEHEQLQPIVQIQFGWQCAEADQ